MKQYIVTGMSCAACSAKVEKAVRAVDGVTDCAVNLLTGSLSVEGSADSREIIKAVTAAGYGAEEKGAKRGESSSFSPLPADESPAIVKRLIASLGFLAVLMYFSMGHRMAGFPVPAFFESNSAALGILQLLLCAAVMIINKKFFISGAKSAFHLAPNMDALVSLGSFAAFAWSVYTVFLMTSASPQRAKELEGSFCFESAAMILTLITVGKLLEAKSKGKTTNALKSLISLAPKTAVVIKDGKEFSVPVEDVVPGDIFAVKPGESIPADGVITEGSTAVDESALTGESLPVDKSAGDKVSAATVNRSGYILCRAARVGEDTTLAQIIKTVNDASATKAPIAKTADKVSAVFVPAVVGISIITLAVWLIMGKGFEFSLTRAISVLVISCPCALGLATPVAVMVGSGVGARRGILFKTAASLEQTGKIKIAALDKTGTLTLGAPRVELLAAAPGISEDELLKAAYSAEIKSEHPLARAIVREAEERGLSPELTEDFTAHPGSGVTALINGETVLGGSVDFVLSKAASPFAEKTAIDFAESALTPLVFARGGTVLGVIGVADALKDDSREAVEELEKIGVRVVMLTGDNSKTARAVAEKAGIKSVISGVMPDGKDAVIRRLQKLGKTAMVGDGINDAPALTSADIGIAIGAGTDVAIDAADVVLMNSTLRDVPAAIRLSRSVLKNIRENLFWAFFYNILCIPLAAGCYTALFGWALNPMVGAAAMSLSSFCVVSNALRLNLFKRDVHGAKAGRKAVKEEELEAIIEEISKLTEEKPMTRTLNIEGMMCINCEAHVVKALLAVDGVESAKASHTENNAVVTLSHEVDNELLKSAVEQAGYRLT